MGVRHELYDRIQSLFGDPGGDVGFFSQVDAVFSAFAASAEDRRRAVADLTPVH
jgi:flagellar hook-associated protein 1 FlgK